MPEEPSNSSQIPELPQVPQPETPAVAPPVIPSPNSKFAALKSKKLLGLPIFIIGIVLLLIGGSAGAYFGVIVPSKPENLLKKAISNTAQQTKVSFDGKFTYESTDKEAELKAVNVTFKGQSDAEKNAFGSSFEVAASGAKLPFEARFVDKNVYFKVGDLSTIKSLMSSFAPEASIIVDSLSKKLSNQWVEVDETLIKQAGGSCVLDKSFAITKEDVTLLQKRYDQVPFAAIKSTAGDKVNGRGATKYEIEIDDNKGAEYLKGLNELSIVKKLKDCSKDSKDTIDATELADNDTTPLTLWVDKGSKRIVKVASHSTAQDEAKEKFKATFEVTLSYGPVNITKPEGAKPFLEVFGDFSQLFGGGTSFERGGGQATPQSGMTAECEAAFQAYINGTTTTPPTNCL